MVHSFGFNVISRLSGVNSSKIPGHRPGGVQHQTARDATKLLKKSSCYLTARNVLQIGVRELRFESRVSA